MTLIAVYNSEGCVGRCDARCYAASTPDCDCICGGSNHGVGQQRAMDNTRALAESWIEQYSESHARENITHFEIPGAQMALPM